jgi:hypothetical protein
MAYPALKESVMLETLELYKMHGSVYRAALAAKVPQATFRARLDRAKATFKDRLTGEEEPKEEFTVMALPDDDLDIDELVELRIKQFGKKREYQEATKLIPVKVKLDGPIGILHFGDPHVDDDGTDLEQLRQHSDLTKIEGVWGANVGDTTNNWVGRLARLYANQSTTAAQAWKLAEWFISRTRWLYMVGGNHDAWSGSADPIKWIARQQDTLYQSSECRIGLRFPNGRQVIVNARHDFAGHSMWNPAHGQMKAAQMGHRDHLMISGHKHTSGYGVIKDPSSGRICHAVQVASYKLYDSYAKERGFRDQTLSPACLTIIDPSLEEGHPDMIKLFWCPLEGVEYLKWKRGK